MRLQSAERSIKKRFSPARTGLANRSGRIIVLSMRAAEIPNFDQLSDLERLLLAEEILGSLRAPGTLPAPLAHRLELDRRWTMHEADPANVLTKDEFRTKISALKR